jgi:hypothetical protein
LAGHVVHAAVPVLFLYLPGTHATHGPPRGPVYPTLHGQSVVPATESELAGHSTQADEFRQFLALPASHSSHAPKFGPVDPGAQKHVASPGIDTVPFGHAWHDAMSSACTANEYMSTGHSEHGAEATCALYEPGAHDRQSALPLPPKPALHGQLVVLSNAICAPEAIDSKSNKMSAFDASVWIR